MNEQWFLLGDIHGSAQPVHYFYQKNKQEALFMFKIVEKKSLNPTVTKMVV